MISKFYIYKFFKALQDAQRLIKMALIFITLFSNIFGIGREIIVNELTARWPFKPANQILKIVF